MRHPALWRSGLCILGWEIEPISLARRGKIRALFDSSTILAQKTCEHVTPCLNEVFTPTMKNKYPPCFPKAMDVFRLHNTYCYIASK